MDVQIFNLTPSPPLFSIQIYMLLKPFFLCPSPTPHSLSMWTPYIDDPFKMPQRLSFGLSIRTVPFPNLHRLHINPEAPCLLCRKDVCTAAHVLRACTVALQQGCFTFCHFCHYSVFSVLVGVLRPFLSSTKVIMFHVIISLSFSKQVQNSQNIQKTFWAVKPYC